MKKRVYTPCTQDWHNAIVLRDIQHAAEAVEWLRCGPPPEDTSQFKMSGRVTYLFYEDLMNVDRLANFAQDRNNPERVRRMIGDILAHRDKLVATRLWSPDDTL